jgi:MFS family permease
VLIGILVANVRTQSAPPSQLNLSIIKNRNVIALAIGSFVFFTGYWVLALYAYGYGLSIGLSDYEAGYVYSMIALPGIISTMISGYMMNLLGTKKVLVGSVAIYSVLLLIFSVARGFWFLLAVAFLMGFFRFIITPSLSTMFTIVGGERETASVAGVVNLLTQGGGIIGPLIAASLISKMGFGYMWLFAVAVSVASILCYSQLTLDRPFAHTLGPT